MGEISWGVGAMGMPGATACVFCNYLRSIFCEVWRNVSFCAADFIWRYGGLVDVLEVFSLNIRVQIDRKSVAGAVGRCAVSRIIAFNGLFQCIPEFSHTRSSKFSLVGQIAKHAFKCTVIGSCRSRKCFPSSAAFLRIYNHSVSKSKDFSFFKSSHGFVADATLYEHWGLTQLLITHSTLQAQMPSKSSDPSWKNLPQMGLTCAFKRHASWIPFFTAFFFHAWY